MSHSYKDLIVWQKSVSMVREVYRATKAFPREETFGLTGQLRRSAISVASNIAEGQGRLSRREFRQFLGHARGSRIEMETQIAIAGVGLFVLRREGPSERSIWRSQPPPSPADAVDGAAPVTISLET